MPEQQTKSETWSPWRKGMSSPNPKGRPRTGMALAEAIRRRVDPDEMVDIAISIARGIVPKQLSDVKDESGSPVWAPTVVKVRDRIAALTWLRDSGYTKPAQLLEVTQGERAPMQFERLTEEQRGELDRMLTIMSGTDKT